ncbi:MAG: hypothetical protein AAGJ50_12250, partial [Pseudomonadota bacterium]
VDPRLAANILEPSLTSAHLLLDMLDRPEALRFSGKLSTDSGQVLNRLAYADRAGRLWSVYFDEETQHPQALSTLVAHPQWGDVASEVRFGNFQEVEGVVVSHLTEVYFGGRPTATSELERLVSRSVDRGIFVPQDNWTRVAPLIAGTPAPRLLSTEELAPGIYLIADAVPGYNVMFVAQEDGILILSTPQSPQVSRDVMAAVRETLPGTNFKAAVPTHHHFDYSGGLLGYLQAEVPIITTAGNVAFVEEIAVATRNIGDDRGPPLRADILTVTNTLSLGLSDATKVQLINVGPTPGVEEIIVAYLPAIKALFVADLFSARTLPLPPASESQLLLAEKVRALNLDIEMVIPVHGSPVSAADFWASVEAAR